MKGINDILTDYGLSTIDEKQVRITLSIVGERINVEEETKSALKQLFLNQQKIVIKDAHRFLEKFRLNDEINPVFAPLLNEMEIFMEFNNRKIFIIFIRERIFYQQLIWSELDPKYNRENAVSVEDKKKILEEMIPGYELQKVFGWEELKEKLKKEARDLGKKIDFCVREIDLEEFSREIFEAGLEKMRVALKTI